MREEIKLSKEALEKFVEPYKPLMFDLVHDTGRTKTERGFILCWDRFKKYPYLSDKPCVGSKCDVFIRKCQWPDSFMTFHTHPSDWLLPSYKDVWSSIAESDALLCLGLPKGKKKGYVRCWKLSEDQDVIRKFINHCKNNEEVEATHMLLDTFFSDIRPDPAKPAIISKLWDWEG